MVSNIVLAIIVGVAVGLGLTFLGMLFISIGGSSALLAATGAFCEEFAAIIGLLAGLWYFFARNSTL